MEATTGAAAMTVERFIEIYARLAEIAAIGRLPMANAISLIKEQQALQAELGTLQALKCHPLYFGSECFIGCFFPGSPMPLEMLYSIGEIVASELSVDMALQMYGEFNAARLFSLYGPVVAKVISTIVAEALPQIGTCHARFVKKDWNTGAILKSAPVSFEPNDEIDEDWSYDFCAADAEHATAGVRYDMPDSGILGDLMELIEARDKAAVLARRGEIA